MAEIIKFPTTAEKEFVNGTKIAKELELNQANESFDPASLDT